MKHGSILFHCSYGCPVLLYLPVLCNLTNLLQKDELPTCQQPKSDNVTYFKSLMLQTQIYPGNLGFSSFIPLLRSLTFFLGRIVEKGFSEQTLAIQISAITSQYNLAWKKTPEVIQTNLHRAHGRLCRSLSSWFSNTNKDEDYTFFYYLTAIHPQIGRAHV